MRQETQGVTETLIKNATEEFLEYGFTKASLRRIAGSSGVSTKHMNKKWINCHFILTILSNKF